MRRKRRVHFHAFMADVHERIHAYRQKLKAGEVKGDDPIAPVAERARRRGLGALLRRVHRHRHRRRHDPRAPVHGPVRPWRGGGGDLQRGARPALRRRPQPLAVPALHRPAAGAHGRWCSSRRAPISAWRSSPAARSSTRRPTSARTRPSTRAFRSLTGRAHGKPMTLTVKGHPVEVPQAAGGVARFSFARSVLEAPGRGRLPRRRRGLSHDHPGGHPGDELRAPQRGEALHHCSSTPSTMPM